MSVVSIDPATGSLLAAGQRIFPIVLSNAPPVGSAAPSGRNGWAEVAASGVNLVRSGRADWSPEFADGQIATERSLLAPAAPHALRCLPRPLGLTKLSSP